MTNQKGLNLENMIFNQNSPPVEGVDVPFGPPAEEYLYRCSHCQREMYVNEAIIDIVVAMAEDNVTNNENCMPTLVCPRCSQETMKYVED